MEQVSDRSIVRVAAVQATPEILSFEGSLAKAERLLEEAASQGAQLAVFPETFVPLYPSDAWASNAASFEGWDELWEQLWDNSVDLLGRLTERLTAVCAAHDIHCVMGVNERDSARPGSLYNTTVTIGPGGMLGKHRKLMPTMHERLFHGIGAGDDLEPIQTDIGRIGGLICWENRMPLARYAVYQGGPQIWAAPNADDSEGWIASTQHVAIESGAFVVSVSQYIPADSFPDDFPAPLPPDRPVFARGGSVIVEPMEGGVIAGPLWDEAGILVADCDLRSGLHAKRWFDAVGHYSREDFLLPRLAPSATVVVSPAEPPPG